MGIHDFTFYDVICRNAANFGNRPAWFEVDEGRTLSFGEFREAVERLAAGLQAAGLKKGDRVGILGKNSREYFLLYGAAAALGLIAVAINWRLSAEEIRFNLNDVGPRALFADAEYQEMVEGIKAGLPSVEKIFNLKGGEGRFLDFNGLLAHGTAFAPPEVSTEDGYVIIHTAAVGGRPRGALLSHGNVLSANLHFMLAFGLTPEDVHLNQLPLFHVAGLFMATHSFHAGCLNVNMSKFDARKAVELIEEKKVSLLFDFPPILALILKAAEESGKSIRSLRVVSGLSTPEGIEAYQKATGGTYVAMYGQTETSCLATLCPYDRRPGAAGQAIALSQVKLVGEKDEPVAVGDTGEIAVRGPMVFKGYWGLPEDTAHAFRGGWHHTGDLGRFDAEGFLWYAGRKPEKELIKPGGENVYPAEVEKVILQHPAVAQTVVFGVPDPKWKEGIKAVCSLKEGHRLEAAELIRFVGERIASYKKPQYVEFVDRMPQLKDGSPDRARVKEAYGGAQK